MTDDAVAATATEHRSTDQLKEIARERVERAHEALIGLSHWIEANPALNYEETLAVGWLEMYVGLEWVYSRTGPLVDRLRESLLEIQGVNVVAQLAVISFSVDRWSGEETVDELRRRVFAIVGVTTDGKVRASVAWFNTEDEIDTFVGAVREIATNTPDSMPRRLPLLGPS
jgi:selenocysteine lyase/cysteine desulfurase